MASRESCSTALQYRYCADGQGVLQGDSGVNLLHYSVLQVSVESSSLPCSTARFVQKVSGLTTVRDVDRAYGVLTLIVFNIVPFRSYTLRPTLLPLLETFCELLFRDV